MKKILLMVFLLPLLVIGQRNYPLAAKKIFKQAQEEHKKGKTQEALTLYNSCIKAEPTFSEAYLNMAIIQYNNKEYTKSLTNSKKALKYNKVQSSIYSQIGKSFFMTGDYDSSAYYLDRAIIFGANSENDFYYLASAENKRHNHERAISQINKSIKSNTSNADYYMVRGDANFGLDDFEAAKVDYEKALSLNQNNNSIYKSLANVYVKLGNSEKAIENIDIGINNAQGDEKINFLILKGNYYHQIGDLENAQKYFDEAFALNNQSAIVLTNQAAVLIDKGEFENAVEKCTQAINVDPTQTEAYFNRGIANEMLRKTDEACSDWEEAFIMGAVKAEEYLNSPTCNE